MTLQCDKCDHLGEPIVKMGGLICARCRVILKFPNDPEYRTMAHNPLDVEPDEDIPLLPRGSNGDSDV